VIPIEETKRIDWNAIRAEYIGGGISQRKLADKHGIPVDKLLKIANREHWKDDREKASNKAAMKAQQKTAVAAADNAVLAADIKKRLLLRLSRMEQKYPFDATEIRTHEGKNTVIFKIRDLTAAYKDLTEDMPKGEGDRNAPIFELLRKLDGECDV
jgi:alanyl-tRNA synthetase